MIQHSYLTVTEVAALHDISRETVRRRIRSGVLPATDVGRPGRPVFRIARDDAALLTRPATNGAGSVDNAIDSAVATLVATAPPLNANQIDVVVSALSAAATARLRDAEVAVA